MRVSARHAQTNSSFGALDKGADFNELKSDALALGLGKSSPLQSDTANGLH